MEQGQDLGCAAPDVFVRLGCRLAARPPRHTGMRHRLEGAGLVLAPDREPKLRPQRVGLLDQLFLAIASGSLTRTTPCLRVAHHHAGFAPGAALLPAQVARVQGAPDRERADRGSVIGPAARLAAAGSTTSRRAVRLALGRAGPFGQDALLRVSAIADPWSAPMAGPHGGEPLAVEAADPGGDRLVVPSSDLVGGGRVARAIRNGQERSGALDLRGGG